MSVVQYLSFFDRYQAKTVDSMDAKTCFNSGLCHLLANKHLERSDNSFKVPLRYTGILLTNVAKDA